MGLSDSQTPEELKKSNGVPARLQGRAMSELVAAPPVVQPEECTIENTGTGESWQVRTASLSTPQM
eukprot:4854943-Amphidinium_carterae.2